MEFVIIIGIILVLLVLVIGVLAFVARCYRKVEQGRALIINDMKSEPKVTFTGGVVWPVFNRAEVMDISVKTIELERRGKEGLICRDNIRADIKVTFFVRVNKTTEDVLKVAQAIGCVRASDQKTMEELFVAKFSEALKTVGKRLDFEQLYTQRDDFKDQIIEVIGKDLNGYVLDDAAIDFLEQTPIEALDKDNILDSQGIRKITQMTAEQAIFTNELRQSERKALAKQNLEADEAILELERRRADAMAKQQREIASVKAREDAETKSIQAEEHRRAELARLKTTEEVAIGEINKARQLEVAEKDRERVLAIKGEQVEKARALEAISREREVELERISKEKALEIQRKEIADVISTRIAVDKKVAEEEERIKTLRMTEEAKRHKDATIIHAEAQASESLVKEIKAAEAREKAAEMIARERITLANADLEASDKQAKAKIRLAEGTQAEAAAEGLAEVRVREADAVAIEKQGLAEARVSLEKMSAEADGEARKGLARVSVQEAQVAVNERQGMVDAAITREKALADAVGIENRGLAEAKAVREGRLAAAAGAEADAVALEKTGMAEARAIRERLSAEAAGLAEKAEAMKVLEGGRDFEEFRLKLDLARELGMENLAARRQIAEAQARVLGEAFASSDIRIVGGDGQFFDRMVKATAVGQSFDAVVDNSDSVQALFKDYLDGDKSFTNDLKDVVASLGSGAEGARDLTIAAVLARVLAGAEGSNKAKIAGLIDQAEKLGLGDVKIGR